MNTSRVGECECYEQQSIFESMQVIVDTIHSPQTRQLSDFRDITVGSSLYDIAITMWRTVVRDVYYQDHFFGDLFTREKASQTRTKCWSVFT